MELCTKRGSLAEAAASGWRQPEWPETSWAGGAVVQTPADLGNWVCPATILNWIVNEAEKLEWNGCGSEVSGQKPVPDESKRMLYVLAYAYARQMYDAHEVVRACRRDAVLQPLLQSGTPFPAEVQRFRRRHRAPLERVLAAVFMRAVRHRFDLCGEVVPAELQEDLRRMAVDRLNTARHLDRVEDC